MYGTGALRLNDATAATEWKKSLQYTIRAGVVYDVEELLADVRALVDSSWEGDDSDRPSGR